MLIYVYYIIYYIGTIVYFNDQIGFIKRNVSLITDDLVTLSSCSNISAACFPMPAAFLSACNNASSSMTELTNGNLDGNPADLANLNSKLTDIYFQIARLPNYDDTAGYLYSINRKFLIQLYIIISCYLLLILLLLFRNYLEYNSTSWGIR